MDLARHKLNRSECYCNTVHICVFHVTLGQNAQVWTQLYMLLDHEYLINCWSGCITLCNPLALIFDRNCGTCLIDSFFGRESLHQLCEKLC
jgi:hypothetical protein